MTVNEIYELFNKGIMVTTLKDPFDRVLAYKKKGE